MPELPEVETVVRSIAPMLTGAVIQHAEFHSPRVTRQEHHLTADALAGRTIQGVRRHGKQIFFDLDQGAIHVHLGMTGKLLWNGVPGKHTHAHLNLDRGTLLYDDIRQFGRFEYFADAIMHGRPKGIDALQLELAHFVAGLRLRRRRIKALLLDQSFVSGLGNIYVDEVLFRAGIHPNTLASRLSSKRAAALYSQISEVLCLAIEHRGSSISDYVDGAGQRGNFQNLHQVYGRKGQPCLACGRAVRRIVVAQRGTHFCPGCQRR